MRPNEDDLAYLWDIDDACADIICFLKDTSFREFEKDKMKRFAIERQLLVIGEASNHLSKYFTIDHNDIPWNKIVGLRNIIAHDYGEILVERIYKNASENVPELKKQISKILSET
ncbi:MAG: DUF86 domain-containing protein [Treponema sp.]|nr:DUF86 domain-containing protein [Treponema sp.]